MTILLKNYGTTTWDIVSGSRGVSCEPGDELDLEREMSIVDLMFSRQLREDLLDGELGLRVVSPYGELSGQNAIDYIFGSIYGSLANIFAVRLKIFVAPITMPPTAEELNGLFGSYNPGAGFMAYVQPVGKVALYQVMYDGESWWVFPARAAD